MKCPVCGNQSPKTAGDLLPIMDPVYNIREIVKQMILLEDHLFHPRKRCPDCITKHTLCIEAFAEEMVTLDKEGEYAEIGGSVAEQMRLCQRWLIDKEPPEKVAQTIREMRKALAEEISDFKVAAKVATSYLVANAKFKKDAARAVHPSYIQAVVEDSKLLHSLFEKVSGQKLLSAKKGHHITLCYNPSPQQASSYRMGQRVKYKVVGWTGDSRSQVLVVKLSGTARCDSSLPHITVSTELGTPSARSNDLLKSGYTRISGPTLMATISWEDGTSDRFDPIPELGRIAAKFKNKKKVDKADGSGKTTVYEYSDRQVSRRNNEKADRVESLRGSIHKLRAQYKKDLSASDERLQRTALAVALIDETYERVGNDGSAKEGHFGVTGWQAKHVSFSGGKAIIKYVGKSGVSQSKTVEPGPVATALKKVLKGKSGDECLFSTEDCKVTSKDVNEYLKDFGVTAKDLRGFHANITMCETLNRIRGAGPELPKDKKDRDELLKKEFDKALKETSDAVGHEADTLRNQYLVPGLEDGYMKDGTVAKTLKLSSDRVAEFTDRFFRIYPKLSPYRKIRVREKGSGGSSHGEASQRGDEIWLFPKFWTLPEKVQYFVLAHEIGHWVKATRWKSDVDFLSAAQSLGIDAWDTPNLPFGQYNFEEAFADSFASYYVDGDVKRRYPQWAKLVEAGKKATLRVSAWTVEDTRELLRKAKKDQHDRDEEQIEKQVKPSPKHKPPRYDLRNRKVTDKDPDTEDLGAEGDKDLSLNYKKVAAWYMAKQAADFSPNEDGAKKLFETYRTEHPNTERTWESFYKPKSEDLAKEKEEEEEDWKDQRDEEIQKTFSEATESIQTGALSTETKKIFSEALESLDDEGAQIAAKSYADSIGEFVAMDDEEADVSYFRKAMTGETAPNDPKEIGRLLAKAHYADRVLFNPTATRGSEGSFQKWSQMNEEDREKAVEALEDKMKASAGDAEITAALRNQINGIRAAAICAGDEGSSIGNPPASIAKQRFIRILAQTGDGRKTLFRSSGDLDLPDRDQIHEAVDQLEDEDFLDAMGASDSPLGEFLSDPDSKLSKKDRVLLRQLIADFALDNAALGHYVARDADEGNPKSPKEVEADLRKIDQKVVEEYYEEIITNSSDLSEERRLEINQEMRMRRLQEMQEMFDGDSDSARVLNHIVESGDPGSIDLKTEPPLI